MISGIRRLRIVYYGTLNRITALNNSKLFLRRMMMEGTKSGIPLKFAVEQLKEFASPLLAESWDNVGLLVEPAYPPSVTSILLTNDLTEDVMDEALLVKANLIVSYHPPIFAPLKRITNQTWKERIVSICLANNIAIYSPHTSWDVVQGGVNDWLASAFDCKEVKPLINQKYQSLDAKYILTIESYDENLFENLEKEIDLDSDFRLLSTEKRPLDFKFVIQGTDNTLKRIVPYLQKPVVTCYYVNPKHSLDEEVSGLGRLCKLKEPISVYVAVGKLKKHLNLPFVQLALARNCSLDHLVKRIAFVAGSGGSVMKNVFCDLKVTGEASHHEVLDSIHNGCSVILTNHSNSERGFLWKFKEMLASKLNNPDVQIVVSTRDADPLKVV